MADAVLVAVDDSDPARAALRFACRNHPDASITVVHVVDPAGQSSYTSMTGAPATELETLQRQRETRTETLFEEVREIAEECEKPVSTVTETGDPATTVANLAAERGYDQIVVGSHGRRGVSRILLGSVAERIVRRSPVPVTIVR